jgi:hypothetical protein
MSTMKSKLEKKTTQDEVVVKKGRQKEVIRDAFLAEAVVKCAGLVDDMKDLEPSIKEYKATITRRAKDFLDRRGTVTLIAGRVKCKVTMRYECVVPEDKVAELRRILGKRFKDLVRVQTKYTGTQVLVDEAAEGGVPKKLLQVKDLSPQISFTREVA